MHHTWDQTEYFIREPSFPKFVQFETSTICNAKCTFCPHSSMKRRGQRGTWRTILKVIDEAIPYVNACCPFLMQEPLVEPRLIAILDNIKQVNRHCKTTVYSNMAAMTEKLAHEIVDSRLLDQLNISFYGPTEEVYNQIQPPLKYQRTKRRIRRFMEIRNESGDFKPEVAMHYIAAPQLMRHCYSYSCEWQNVVDRVGFVHYDDFHGVMPRLSEAYEETIWKSPAQHRTPCSRLWLGLNVLCDGSVTPCCVDFNGEVKFGNVNKHTLQEIWLGKKFQRFREKHIQRKFSEIPLCRECRIWRYQHPEGWNEFWLKPQVPQLKM